MARYSWLLVPFACFVFSGCAEETLPAPDEAETKTTTPIEDDLKDAGMGKMTDAEYTSGGKK
ncbi:MAG: hypothetical protein R3C19_10455 [Planctomycetaceae bacterium]